MNSSYNTTYSTTFSIHNDQFWVQSLIAGSSEAEVGVYVMFDDATQQITHQSGIIVSHREYTHEDYPSSVDSMLNIEVNGTLSVTLFVFKIGLEDTYSTCYDYLQINGEKYGRNCGKEISQGDFKTVFKSDGNFELSFYTNIADQREGFLIQYQLSGQFLYKTCPKF